MIAKTNAWIIRPFIVGQPEGLDTVTPTRDVKSFTMMYRKGDDINKNNKPVIIAISHLSLLDTTFFESDILHHFNIILIEFLLS